MTERKTKGPHYSGAHANPRRKLSATPEEWAAMDAAAVSAGTSWAEWARATLLRAAARNRPKK